MVTWLKLRSSLGGRGGVAAFQERACIASAARWTLRDFLAAQNTFVIDGFFVLILKTVKRVAAGGFDRR